MHELVRDPVTGRFRRRYSCSSCQMLRVNVLPCHESGCPDSWIDTTRECRNCECNSVPESQWQHSCDDACAVW